MGEDDGQGRDEATEDAENDQPDREAASPDEHRGTSSGDPGDASKKDEQAKDDKAKDDDAKDDAAKDDKADEDEDDGPPLYKRPVFWIVVGAVAAVLIVGGLLWWLHARKYESTDDAFVDAHIVRIAAQTSGRLTRVWDVDNRRVRRGEMLAVIEPGGPEATRAEAAAGVAQADAQIGEAQARVIQAEAARRQAAANALAPEAEARRTEADYQRYVVLRRLDPLAAAPTQIDQARAQRDSAAAQAKAARRQVDTAGADLLAARRQVQAARAQRRAAEARVAQANVTVSYLHIRAPIEGQVVNRQVEVGSYVAPGQQLMAIVPYDMWITANFKETQLTRMRIGQPVRIRVDAYPGVDFPGHVDSIQRGAGQAFQLLPPQNATGNYVKVVQRVPVRIVFDGAQWRHYHIGPGMSATPRVTVR